MPARKLGAALAALALGTALAVAPGTPAAAAPSCPSEYFCIWYSPDFENAKWQWSRNDSNWGDNYYGNMAATNQDYSWFNNGIYCYNCDHVRVYDYANYGTLTLCIHRGQWIDVDDGAVAVAAAGRGNSHTWGGECTTKHIPF